MRVFAPHVRDHVLPGRLFEIDEQLGWKLEANRRVTHRTRYFEVTYATNAAGFRDQARGGSAGGGSYGVLLYGDSQAFGWGVAEESRFSNLLERSLPFVEVWNRAVPGYGLDQQILSYEQSDVSPKADEVIFFVSGPTLERSHDDVRYGKPKPIFVKDGNRGLRRVLPASVRAARWQYEFLSPLYLPQFLSRRFGMVRASLEEARAKREVGEGVAGSTRPVSDFEKELLILARDAAAERRQRMTILAALLPEMNRDLRDFCDRHGIVFVAVDLERLRRDHVFGMDDPHWTPAGHRLVAEQILSQVNWEARRDD